MLSGKPILVLFATNCCYECGRFLPKLKKLYDENNGTAEHFEVIYISLDCVQSTRSFPQGIQKMQWLIHAYEPRFAHSLAERVFGVIPCLPAIAAFGSDGNLLTKESNLGFKEVWNCKYPFIEADIDEEVCKELMDVHHWNLKEQFAGILPKRKQDISQHVH